MPRITQYCLDTNVFVNSWRKHYPIDVSLFAPIWEKIDAWAKKNILFAPEEVYREIQMVDDDLLAWVKVRRSMFRPPTVEVQTLVKAILRDHPRLVDTVKGRSRADPWVIAHAQEASAIVVTEEEHRKNPGKSPKIPDVCEALGVPYMTTLDFIRKLQV